MTIRRVTSARGWGEVNIHTTTFGGMAILLWVFWFVCLFCFFYMRMLQHQPSSVLLSGGGIWCRRHTWTSYRVQDLSQRHSTEVRPGMHARCISIETIFPLCCSLFNCHLFSQLLDSPGGFAVLSSRFASKLLFDDSAPPGPEHHGLFAVALGSQQCHDDQSGPGHKEQPLYSGFASTYKEQIQKHVQIDLIVNW